MNLAIDDFKQLTGLKRLAGATDPNTGETYEEGSALIDVTDFEPLPIQIDGEQSESRRHVTVSVLPKAVTAS